MLAFCQVNVLNECDDDDDVYCVISMRAHALTVSASRTTYVTNQSLTPSVSFLFPDALNVIGSNSVMI